MPVMSPRRVCKKQHSSIKHQGDRDRHHLAQLHPRTATPFTWHRRQLRLMLPLLLKVLAEIIDLTEYLRDISSSNPVSAFLLTISTLSN